MPDALEVAAALDAKFAATGELVGPLHGVVIAIKDQFDTFDMRTTSGADASYANDRPPDDATFVARLRAAGAIIIGKSEHGRIRGRRPQLVRRHVLQSVRHGALAGPLERRLGLGRGRESRDVRNRAKSPAHRRATPARTTVRSALAPTQELVSRDGMMPRRS